MGLDCVKRKQTMVVLRLLCKARKQSLMDVDESICLFCSFCVDPILLRRQYARRRQEEGCPYNNERNDLLQQKRDDNEGNYASHIDRVLVNESEL